MGYPKHRGWEPAQSLLQATADIGQACLVRHFGHPVTADSIDFFLGLPLYFWVKQQRLMKAISSVEVVSEPPSRADPAMNQAIIGKPFDWLGFRQVDREARLPQTISLLRDEKHGHERLPWLSRFRFSSWLLAISNIDFRPRII